MWRLGVRVVADGIMVSSYVYTKHVPWSEIEKFVVISAGHWRNLGGVARRGHHAPLVIWGIATGRKTEGEVRIAELNHLLDAWRADHPSG
jgi:hypothetical protein